MSCISDFLFWLLKGNKYFEISKAILKTIHYILTTSNSNYSTTVNKTLRDPQGHCLLSTYLAHFAFAVSSEERHVIDLIHHHKVLLFPLEVLQCKERCSWSM